MIYAGARIGARATIGTAAVVHAGTEVGEDCLIEDGAVLESVRACARGSSAAGAGSGRSCSRPG